MSSSSDSEVNLCCPICLEKYNTDDRIPIVARRCAHTICQPCATKRNSPVCVVCGVTSVNSNGDELRSTKWHKNFALIECLEAMKQVDLEWEQKIADLKSEYDNDIDYMSCGQCGVREKRERMKICCGCAGIKEMDSTGTGIEEKVQSVTICAFCHTENHMGHSVINYITFKVHNSLSLTSSDGVDMVNSMDELCAQEAQNGAEQLAEWKKIMRGFNVQHHAAVTYRQCLSINDSLKNEAEIVCNASEDTLPSLRKLTKTVKESRDRVSTLLSSIMTTKPEKEGAFGYFTRLTGFVKGDGICLFAPDSDIVVCVGRVPDEEAIARDNRNRRGRGMEEYLYLEPSGMTKRIHEVHRCLTKKGFAFKVNGKFQSRRGGELVTIWKVVYGGTKRDCREEEREVADIRESM